jgi:RNA polymerase sigma-70 factor (ECF subfamily)
MVARRNGGPIKGDARRAPVQGRRAVGFFKMRMSRDELVEALGQVAKGDTQAFIRVYRSTSVKLFGIVVRILGRGELAEEVLQEVFLTVWQRAGTFDAGTASPITWLATIARNRALDQVRRRPMTSLEDIPELLNVPSEEDVSGRHLAAEELARLTRCLDGLEAEKRQVLQLVYYRGMTREEVAGAVGRPVSTVKTWLRRSLAQLKDCLDK